MLLQMHMDQMICSMQIAYDMIIYTFIFGILIVDVCPFLIMRAVSVICNFSKLLATELYFGLQKLPIVSHISCMTFYYLISRSSYIFAGGHVPSLLVGDASSSVTQNRAAGEPAVKRWWVSGVSLRRPAGAGIPLIFMYSPLSMNIQRVLHQAFAIINGYVYTSLEFQMRTH